MKRPFNSSYPKAELLRHPSISKLTIQWATLQQRERKGRPALSVTHKTDTESPQHLQSRWNFMRKSRFFFCILFRRQTKTKVHFFLYFVCIRTAIEMPPHKKERIKRKRTRIVSNKSCINPSNRAKQKKTETKYSELAGAGFSVF